MTRSVEELEQALAAQGYIAERGLALSIYLALRLKRPLFGMHRITWPDDEHGGVEFHLAHGEMIRLLRSSGFVVEDLIEVRAPEDAQTSYGWMSGDWASKWPCEEVWKARKRL